MTDQTPNNPNPAQQEPFIPPQYLLILAILGIAVAFIVALTQPEFGVIGYGGLAFGILALLMWVLLAPQQARSAFTGRTARYGGTSLLVTILLLVVLVGIYVVVRNLKLSADLTKSNTFSLTDESRHAVEVIGADPNASKIHLIAFYGPSQAGQRDQATLLFDDYEKTSNGKIDYEFVDPDRAPQTASLYKVTTAGQIAVVKLDPTTGDPDTANAKTAASADQQTLTNTILRVSASGIFNAYVLTVEDSNSANMTIIRQVLTQNAGWTVKDLSLVDLASPTSEVNLDDPNVTGQVIVIPGGSTALTDDELKIVQDYVAKGGDLVIMAGSNLNAKLTSLATSDNLNNWLTQDFGLTFDKDVVIDKTQAYQTAIRPVATDMDATSFITTNGIPRGQSALIFELANSITVAATPPENVTTVALARSSGTSYGKTELQDILDNQSDKTDADPAGPLVLAASAENTQTGARVILYGSTSIADDNYASLQNSGVDNINVMLNSLVWATKFNDFVSQVTVQQQQRPQDTPLFADQQTLRNINFITIVLLPFGVLLIGILVWWTNRERAR